MTYEVNYELTKDEIKRLVTLLDSHNFECCNSVGLAKLITEVKTLLEDLAAELHNDER